MFIDNLNARIQVFSAYFKNVYRQFLSIQTQSNKYKINKYENTQKCSKTMNG